MTWTDPADVTGAWIGEGMPTDDAKVATWIGKAEREVRRHVPDVQARIDAEGALLPPITDLLEATKDVVVAMVTRVFRNPEGVRQRSSAEGPYSGSIMYGGNTPGILAMTDEELASLQGVKAAGAFSVDLIPSTSPFYVGL